MQLVLTCFVGLILAWVWVFWQGLSTAIDIWLISEVFNHCLFVIPGAFYLIYLKRRELDLSLIKPSYLALLFACGSLALYAIGLAGDVQLFMHVATFTFLPLSIWAFIGHKLAYKILFPLVFILFCIPVGEELVPSLQEITADLSMLMLNWSGIPVYRSGLYIEIPQGQFLVAEACSGISFFIASIVIGSLYSYLNIYSVKRRVLFMGIAILFPIIANAIRVFGIIMTGYLTDMEHAVGADHLIYGWVFFALVIVCLLFIGEWVREKQPITQAPQSQNTTVPVNRSAVLKLSSAQLLVMLLFSLWYNAIHNQLNAPLDANLQQLQLSAAQLEAAEKHKSDWQPEFNQPFQAFQLAQQLNGQTLDLYLVWYPKGQGELISSLNRLYPETAWTLESSQNYIMDTGQSMTLSVIVTPSKKRLLSYWYLIDGKVFTNKSRAKLYEIYRILMGSYQGSGLIAISTHTSNASQTHDIEQFIELTQANLAKLNQYFAFE
ncbi:exosortase A [Paraglaciecola aestuariivivens]